MWLIENKKTYRTYSLKSTVLVWPRIHTTASTALGGSRIQERIRSAKDELERHSEKNWDSSRKRER